MLCDVVSIYKLNVISTKNDVEARLIGLDAL